MRRSFLETPRPNIPRWAADGAVVALWGAVAPLALVAPKVLQILVWLLPLASLATLARSGTGLPGLWRRPIWLVMALPAWALLAAPVSVDSMESAVRALRLAGEFTALCLLFTSTAALPAILRRRATIAVLIGAALAAAMILLDLLTRGAVLDIFWGAQPSAEWRRIGYNRGETILAMVLPIAAFVALGGRRLSGPVLGWCVAAFLVGVAAVLSGASNSAKAALALACAVLLVVYAAPGLLRAFAWVCTALALTLPVIIDSAPPRPMLERTGASLQSMIHRTVIWDFTIARIKEKPVLGWGLDASRRMPGGDDQVIVTGQNKQEGFSGPAAQMSGQVMPLHPHNGVLQIWLELGGVGAVLTAGLLLLGGRRLCRMRLSRAARAVTAASFTAGFSVALVSYGLWQGWWLASLFLMIGLPALMADESAV